MSRARFPLSTRPARVGVLLLGAVLFLGACQNLPSPIPGSRGERLSFAQMQALNPGVQGEWIVQEYPFARDVQRRSDGTLQQLTYVVEDPQGSREDVVLLFDNRGTLVRKHYEGPIVRPPNAIR